MKDKNTRRLLICLSVFTLIFSLLYSFRSQAEVKTNQGLFTKTASHSDDLPNYDIRSDKNAYEKIAHFRQSLNQDASTIADIKENFVRGEQALKAKIPSLKIEYNSDIRIPEIIAPDVKQGRAFLTGASDKKRSDILLDFLRDNDQLIGVSDEQINGLKVFSDYTNPDANLSFVELNQEINGIPVFRGEIKAGFTKNREIIRIVNNLAPGLDYGRLSTDFGDPLEAVRTAASYIVHELNREEKNPPAAPTTPAFGHPSSGRRGVGGSDKKAVFGTGDWAITAEKMFFPTEPGVAVPAWRVLIWQPVNAYYIIVDAETGTMLWRKNLTEDQTQPSSYDIYANPNAMINVADSPAPMSPGPIDPTLGTQGAIIVRTNISRIGNEAPYTFNNLGWINDGQNITDGNAVESGLDLVAPNGIDAGTQATGSPNRTFASAWNPPPGNPPPGDAPSAAEARRGAVIQQFYIMNWYHDELYRLGFTEPARNYQQDNFGRGGFANDRISAEGQDSGGLNNANFASGADGVRGRMQMYVWSGPTPDRDGTTDADIMIHEVTHGTSNRLHGNSLGLSVTMSRAMGEGWSDFYAHCLLSEPSDPINGIYPLSGYALFQAFGSVGTQNYYYGIRRFPKAVMAFTGGTLNRPHNPLTFADIDQSQINTSDGAFPAMSGPHISTTADQVHAAGEVWSSALWEVRAKFVTRLGWADGNRRVLQYVTDGMKLAPLAPTFLSERDAILAAALASGTAADVRDIWAGFAIRGMGFSASIQNKGSGFGDTRVTEAFDLANLAQAAIGISDFLGDNDGAPEPGETLTLTIPLTNNTGNTATGVTLQLVGGATLNYGTINHAATVNQLTTFLVPAATPCGSAITLTFSVNSSLGPITFVRSIIIGAPNQTFSESFDGVTAPAFPAGWTATPVSGGINFVTSATAPDTAPNSAFALDPLTVGGGTDLTSPVLPISASAALVTFRHSYETEPGWDGGVLEISIAGGAFQDTLSAGGAFLQNGYNGQLSPGGTNNPLSNRQGWNGSSGGYITTIARLPAAANGQNVQLRWRFGADSNTAVTGWNVDTIGVNGSYTCSFLPPIPKTRADFDGDGISDLSVFRPSEGNWYLNRSTTGFGVINWGLAGDQLVPGDYDADGKTDTAIFRPSSVGGAVDFFVLESSTFTFNAYVWGNPGDIPVVTDYDGDNKADPAVFRPTDSVWYVLASGGGIQLTQFGASGDMPVAGDFDGDGKGDLTVYRNGTWITQRSSGGTTFTTFGLSTDRPVPADYDGDGRDDVAVYRPSSGVWYIQRSSNGGFDIIPFGNSTDIPVPGDYDGDGRDDQAVYRAGIWYLNRSTSGLAIFAFGLGSDIAVPSEYVP